MGEIEVFKVSSYIFNDLNSITEYITFGASWGLGGTIIMSLLGLSVTQLFKLFKGLF